ncbi:MAG: autotransporter-associated beta strand repeat-containing protein, partial [Roseimicrobium sp.]
YLESANSFTGGLQINAGDVNFTDDNRLGAAGESVVLNGGTLTPVIFNTQTMSIRGFEVGRGGGTISAQANGGVTGQTVILGGPITGTGNLLFTGDSEASYLVNLANDGFSGDVDIRYIDVRLGTSEATLGSGDIRFTSGNGSLILEAAATVNNRLLFIGDGLGVNAVQVNSTGATLAGDIIMQVNGSIWSQVAGNSVTTISGDISGFGPLRLGTASGSSSSNHTFILSGDNVHTAMEIGGITRIMSEQALGVETASLTFVNASDSATTGFGGTLQAGADNIELSMTRSLVVNTGVGNARIDTQGYTMTVASTISGNSHLTKVGTGRLVLTGNNTLTGYTTVAAGTLQVGAGGTQDLPAYGSVAGVGVIVNGSGAVLAGTGRILSDTTVQQGQIRAGDQTGSADGRGTLTFGGSVTLTGSGSSIRFGVGGATGNGSPWIINGTDISALASGAPSLMSGIAGNHDHLQFTGSGTLVWNPGAKLTVEFENGYSGGWAHVLNLMDWVTAMSTTGSYTVGGFILGNGDEGADLELPDLTGTGLYWDTTLFKSHGVLVMVPEPGRAMLIMAGLTALLFRRRR